MKTYFTCYADDVFAEAQKLLLKEADGMGFDYLAPYHKEDIMAIYYLYEYAFEAKELFRYHTRPNGGCIWKPYIILDLMKKIDYGDLVYYSDCGDLLQGDYLSFIKDNIQDGVFLVSVHAYPNEKWTKESCFVLMGCTDEKYRKGSHLEAGQLGFIKTDNNMRLISEWMGYCSVMEILLPGDKSLEKKCYTRHSCDQSILTNLQIKYNLPTVDVNRIIGTYVRYNVR